MVASPPPPARDPAMLAHRYDPQADAIHFVRVDRAARAGVPFLVDRELGTATAGPIPVARGEAVAGPAPAAPIHFVFHSAFCCSTLMVRALDLPGIATTLSEPQILADLVGWRHRGGDPAAIRAVLDDALTLLARPFVAGEAVVVKPSNVVNGLASAMLALRPDARAILMSAPLEVFLSSIARKGLDGRLWVRDLLLKQLADGLLADMGFEAQDHLRQTDLQVAAVGWLAQARLFAALAARFPAQVRSLDSERLVARPTESLAAAGALFGLSIADDEIGRIAGRVFARDSKSGSAFAPGQRAAERTAGAAAHADEIAKVAAWARVVADNAGIPMDPPAPLIG